MRLDLDGQTVPFSWDNDVIRGKFEVRAQEVDDTMGVTIDRSDLLHSLQRREFPAQISTILYIYNSQHCDFSLENVITDNLNVNHVHLQSEVRWKVSHASLLSEHRKFVKTLQVGNYSWQVSLFPEGNGQGFFAVHMNCTDLPHLPSSWLRTVSFAVALVNKDSKKTQRQEGGVSELKVESPVRHVPHLAREQTLLAPDAGFVQDDCLLLDVRITIQEGKQCGKMRWVRKAAVVTLVSVLGMCIAGRHFGRHQQQQQGHSAGKHTVFGRRDTFFKHSAGWR